MTGTGDGSLTTPALPQSAWVLGWACLAGEVANLVERGTTDADSALLSVPLSALVVAWVSYGVLRARTVRVWFAAVLLMLTALFGLVALGGEASMSAVVGAATAVVAFAALLVYTRSQCFAQLHEEPRRMVPALGGLVAIAVAVGALGGLAADPGADDYQSGFHVRIGL